MQVKSYSLKTLYLIAITAIAKLLLLPLIELGNDEVYYYTYALQLDWNHFDHPPMVGLFIRLTTLNLWLVNEFTIRLGSVLVAACSTWFIFKLGKLLVGERTGWFAAIIYTASVYTGFIAGFFILPDSPQMIFYTSALYIMAYLIVKREGALQTSVWLLLGLMIGFATLCKVHGLFLWMGFGLFILIKRSDWLFNWRLYAAVFITIVCILPILYWNWEYDFITYTFHTDRVVNHGIQWNSFGREIAGELVYQNPVIFILLIFSLIAFFLKRIQFDQKRISIWILCMSLPMLFVFWGISLFNPTLPHWSGPAFIPLFLIGGLYLDKTTIQDFPKWIKVSISFVSIVLLLGIILIRYSPINFGSKEPENYGEYCPTLDLSGWKDLGKEFTAIVKQDQLNGIMKPNPVLISNKWFPAGHIEFYVSRPSEVPLIGIGSLQNLHKFAWLNNIRTTLQLGSDAYCIVPSNLPFDVVKNYGIYFKGISKPFILKQVRSGGVVRFFYIYRLKNCQFIPAKMV